MGDFIVTDYGRFELVDNVKPKDDGTLGYSYELEFDAYYRKWKNKRLKYMPNSGSPEGTFTLTSNIITHANIIKDNLDFLAKASKSYLYDPNYTGKGSDYTFVVDASVDSTKSKVITYSNSSILDAIANIAQTFECEWWVEGNLVHFGTCENTNEVVDFKDGENIVSMSSSQSQASYANRVYAFGAARNLPSGYKQNSSADVTKNGVVEKRLMLPTLEECSAENKKLLEDNGFELKNGCLQVKGLTEDEYVEGVTTNDDIYPRNLIKTSNVTYYEKDVEDESTPEEGDYIKRTFYRVKGLTIVDADGNKTGDMAFRSSYILSGKTLHIIFQSGSLNGMDFECQFNPDGESEILRDSNGSPILKDGKEQINPAAQVFEIVANEDYGRFLPDTVLHPKDGDTFVLYNWDSTKLGNTLVTSSANELLTDAIKNLKKSMIDPTTYTCTAASDYSYNDGKGQFHFEGDRVNLFNKGYDMSFRASRIIGYELHLDVPFDSVKYTVGEKPAYSRLNAMSSQIEELVFNGQSYLNKGGSGNSIYIIKSYDTTVQPTDFNVFSAKRVENSYLHKDKTDAANFLIKFLRGLQVGDYSALSGGDWSLDELFRSHLTTDYLNVRMKAIFETLEILHTDTLGGELFITTVGSNRILKVEEVNITYDGVSQKAYRCYFLGEQDGSKVENKWKVGDQARSKSFNLTAGKYHNVGNHYYWRLVIGVSSEAVEIDGKKYHYVDLSDIDKDAASDEPMVDDILNQCGNRTNITRQSCLVFSAVDTYSPCITLYHGVDGYTFNNKEYVNYGVNHSTNKAFFHVYGDMYFGDRPTSANNYEGESYVKFDSETKKVTIKGELDIKSTYDGKTLDKYIADKRRIFGSQPVPPYDVNDMWVNATYPSDGSTYKNEILKCSTAKAEGEKFDIADWKLASKYTDDTKAEEAKKAAEKAQEEIKTTQSNLNTLGTTVSNNKKAFDDFTSDGYLDSSEIAAIAQDSKRLEDDYNAAVESYNNVVGSKFLLDKDGNETTYKTDLVSAKATLDSAKNELITYLSDIVSRYNASDSNGKATIKAAAAQKYTNFTNAYKAFYDKLGVANNYITSNLFDGLNTKLITNMAGLEYIKAALVDGDTVVKGGLILSTLIALRNDKGNVTAGINGADTKENGIALWLGGKAIDKQASTTTEEEKKIAAKSLLRFDGTGYFANGNLWWDADGILHADPTSFIINKNNVGVQLALFAPIWKSGTTDTTKLANVLSIDPQKPFTHLDVSGNVTTEGSLKIGGIYLSYDSANNALRLSKDAAGKEAANFYALGGITAYGKGAGTTGGGGLNASVISYARIIKGDYTDADLTSIPNAYAIKALSSRIDNIATELGGLNLSWNNITGKPSTFTPSAHTHKWTEITDRITKVSQLTNDKGYLTAHQSLASYYTKAEIDAKGYTTNKGTVTSVALTLPTGLTCATKVITTSGTFAISLASGYSIPTTTKQTAWDGAVSAKHTHSNKSVLDGITSTKVTCWDSAYDWYALITTDEETADGVINKWNEVVSFLANIAQTDTLSGIVDGINKSISDEVTRAKKAEGVNASGISTNKTSITTLQGYFTSGSAKKALQLTNTRKLWGNSFNGTADINGSIIVPDGKYISIGNIKMEYDATNKALKITNTTTNEVANLYTSGGVSAYGVGASSSSGGGLNGSVKAYADAIRLTTENLSEVASAYSVAKLYSEIQNVASAVPSISVSVPTGGNALTGATYDASTGVITFAKGTFLTAHQSLDGYVNAIATSGSGNAITSVSKSGKGITFTKGATFLTSHQSLANYYTKSSVDSLLSGKSATSHTHSVKINGVTKTIAATGGTAVDLGTYLTSHQSLADYAKKSEIPTKVSQLTNDTGYITSSGSCAYATNADKVDGVHVTWAGELTSTTYLTAWEANGSALRAIKPANVTVGNSDKLDGIHANGLLTALSNSDKGISITVGGTTKSVSNISVNYASSAGNADTVDGEHASAFTRIVGRHSIGTSGTAPYNYIHLFRIANSSGYSTLDCEIDFRTRYHSAKLEIRISTQQYPYNSGGTSISIIKKVVSGRTCNLWVLPTVQTSNYNYYDVYYESGAWNSGSYGITLKGKGGTLVFEHKGTNLTSLPDKVIPVSNNVATSATKLQTPRTIWGQSFDGTGNVNGTIYINNSDSENGAIILNNNINANARISAIKDQVVFNTGAAIRFGATNWEYSDWAGLKYDTVANAIYLGIADGTVFNYYSNKRSNGTLKFPGITTITPDSGARIGGSGGDLYLGNGNNSNWVKVQDMCSQADSNNWKIMQGGYALFKDITIINTATINGETTINSLLKAKAIKATTADVNAFGTNVNNWDGSIAANVTNMFNGIPQDNIQVEYSMDNGATWNAYFGNPENRFNLVNDNVRVFNYWLGSNNLLGDTNADKLTQIKKNQLRVTVKIPAEIYQELSWISVDVNNGVDIKCQVYFGNSTGGYTEYVSKIISGWSHKCDICVGPLNVNVGNDNYRYVRLVFSHLNTHTALRNGIVAKIRALALTKYSYNGDRYTISTTGHIYDYDAYMNTYFPNSILAKGGVTAYQSSDIRLKQDLRKLDYLGIIKAMGGTYGFAWKKDNTRSIGWIAQHVLHNPQLKDIVETDEKGYYKINYWSPKLIATAFGAIEQVGDEVSRLKARVVFLESEVQRLSGDKEDCNKKRLDNKNINSLN
nr:MAG: Prophage endopeptidase tail [Bacteriophage sp.]